MGRNISLYMSDDTLAKLDAEVATCAKRDAAMGLTGRQATSRSKVIERALQEYLDARSHPSLDSIKYAIVDVSREFGAQKVTLFGSYARSEATPESDVDILLEKGDIRGLKVLDFQDALSQRLNLPVDVVTTDGAGERLLSNIEKDAVVLYDRGEEAA